MFLIQALCDMGESLGLEETTFIQWQLVHEPRLFHSRGNYIPPEVVANLADVSKQHFLQACELLWRQRKLRALLGPRSAELKGV
jgi:hypothetical protein